MRIKILLFSILFIFCAGSAFGQWDAQISQYWRIKNTYNPSFAGETNNLEATLLHRMQWLGVDNAPRTSFGMASMPLKFLGMQHGVGITLQRDKAGLFSNMYTMVQYTYKHRFGKNKYLNIGLQGGMVNVEFDANGIRIPDDNAIFDPSDPAIPIGAATGKSFDAGLGISWTTPQYYVGLSVTHLLEPSIDLGDDKRSFISRTYYLVGGYNIALSNPLIVLQPSALIKSDNVLTQVDVTARAEYNKMFNGGISWRKDDGFVFLLGVKYKIFDAGYSYDLSTSEISKASSGSHELFVKVSIPLHQKKSGTSRKSIRIL